MQLVDEWVENPIYLDDEDEEDFDFNEQYKIKGEKQMEKVKNEKQYNIVEDYIKATQEFKTPTFNKTVKYGNTNFSYADLNEILRCVQKPLLKHGFIIVHLTTYENDRTWLKTMIKYKTNEVFFESIFPIDILNKKMQEIGAQITYAKRYHITSMCCICADPDTDAFEIRDQKLNETIGQEEIHSLNRYLNKLGAPQRSEIFRVINTNQVNKITKNKYPEVLDYIKKYVNEQKSKSISYEDIQQTS